MKSLMDLVSGCSETEQKEFEKEDSALKKAIELDELGFADLSKEIYEKIRLKSKLAKISQFKYIKITDKQIQKFLKSLVPDSPHSPPHFYPYFHSHSPPPDYEALLSYFQSGSVGTFVNGEPIAKEYRRFKSPTIEGIQYIWQEVSIKKYKNVPPDNILIILKTHQERKIFNDFTIATVEKIKDPLLLGRIDNCPDRFFICQWGEDIVLDDLI